jgi:hypothetical protein
MDYNTKYLADMANQYYAYTQTSQATSTTPKHGTAEWYAITGYPVPKTSSPSPTPSSPTTKTINYTPGTNTKYTATSPAEQGAYLVGQYIQQKTLPKPTGTITYNPSSGSSMSYSSSGSTPSTAQFSSGGYPVSYARSGGSPASVTSGRVLPPMPDFIRPTPPTFDRATPYEWKNQDPASITPMTERPEPFQRDMERYNKLLGREV